MMRKWLLLLVADTRLVVVTQTAVDLKDLGQIVQQCFQMTFFVQLLENEWTEKKWDGPKQYEDKSGALMMLPTDLELRDDPVFRKYSEKFAKDEEYFFAVFSSAYEKLTQLGCVNLCPRAV
mmetsp:Transcript_47270/g.72214  ORF Transcript_47270/g.72214 Transcript_47270/m.72214 type:complete len:121 (+) Transcript_47270:685-1047(+)